MRAAASSVLRHDTTAGRRAHWQAEQKLGTDEKLSRPNLYNAPHFARLPDSCLQVRAIWPLRYASMKSVPGLVTMVYSPTDLISRSISDGNGAPAAKPPRKYRYSRVRP